MFKIAFKTISKTEPEKKVETPVPAQPVAHDLNAVTPIVNPANTNDLAAMSNEEILTVASQTRRAIQLERPDEYTAEQVEFISRAENMINLMISFGVRAVVGRKIVTHYGIERGLEVVRCYYRDRARLRTDLETERYFLEKAEVLEAKDRHEARKQNGSNEACA